MGVFDKTYGADLLRKPGIILLVFLMASAGAWLTARLGMMAGMGMIMFPFIIIFIAIILKNPKVGLFSIFVMDFIGNGLSRYVALPWGLSVDVLFVLIYLALFFKSFRSSVHWRNARTDLTLLAVIWYGYVLLELLNPEVVSRVAWFYAMRGVALYMLFIIPLIFILMDKRKDLDMFLFFWAGLSILASLKGMQQHLIGVDPFEQRWLDNGGAVTHILFGKLRVFSFYSDAGQFGAAQAHTAVVFSILALNRKGKPWLRIFYAVTALLGFYGMMISGTRGAIAVPLMGFAFYVILRKNIKVLLIGAILGAGVLFFFKYTTIGNSNYAINRMRTAFNPHNASLQVRLANQRKFKAYLANRPFGGGVGSSGNWGLRFSPNTFLANTPTDSWYVAIWAEEGIVGLILHLFILFYVIIKSAYRIMFKIRDDWIRAQMSALVCGILGIMAASYGNGVLGQMPTGLLIYSSMAFLFMSEKLDREALETDVGEKKVVVG